MDTDHIETYIHPDTGVAYKVTYWYDIDFGAPDKEFDGHGHILDMCFDPTDEEEVQKMVDDGQLTEDFAMRAPLMRQIIFNPLNNFAKYYDFVSSINVAMTEWGCKTSEAAVAAVEQDYKYIHGWYNDMWYWIGITVQRADEDDPWHETTNAVGGFESLIFDDQKAKAEVLDDLILDLEHSIKAEQFKDQLTLPLDTAAVVHLTHYR